MAVALFGFWCREAETVRRAAVLAATWVCLMREDAVRLYLGDAAAFRIYVGPRDAFVVLLASIFFACTAVPSGPPRSMELTRVPLSMHATTLLVSILHLLDDELSRRGPLVPPPATPVKGEMRAHVKQRVCRPRAAHATL